MFQTYLQKKVLDYSAVCGASNWGHRIQYRGFEYFTIYHLFIINKQTFLYINFISDILIVEPPMVNLRY